MTKKQQEKMVKAFIKQQGGLNSAAETIGVHISSLWRWRSGVSPLTGSHLAAVEAVLKHPEDYREFPDKAVSVGRPKGK